MKKQYHSITPCQEGFHIAALSLNANDPYSRDKKYYFLDSKGDIIFSDQGYKNADAFVDGLAAVQTNENKWVYLNDLGHELKLIPEEINKIRSVTSFHFGISVITTAIIKNNRRSGIRVFFIDREGNIILDSHELFNKIPVLRIEKFHNGLVALELDKEDRIKNGFHLVYLNNQGKIILQTENSYSNRTAKSGYILEYIFDHKNEQEINKIYNLEGKEVTIPNIFKNGSKRIYHINDQYFQISHASQDHKSQLTIFDAKTGQNIYNLVDYVLAIKGNLISLVDKATMRFYVIDKNTKKIVYDSK